MDRTKIITNNLILITLILIISSCNYNKKEVEYSKIKLSQLDSIQIITKLISNKDFTSEIPNCKSNTPFIIAKNGYIMSTYDIKYKEHPLILKSLVDILYINGKYEDNPIKEMPIYRIGPKILIEISKLKLYEDSIFIQMTLCGNGTFFNYSFKRNSNNNWDVNLLQKGNTKL